MIDPELRPGILLRSRATALLASLLAAWVTLAVARPHAATEPSDDPLTIGTDGGPVRGVSENGVRRFLGLPYAAPPVGPLRWRPPEPPEPWDAPLDASRAGPSCAQTLPIVNLPTGDESCLFLNVYTPDPPPRRRAPVMVWIHGGGFTVGSAMDDDPRRLVARTGVVAVTLNYRLGPLGFLAHPLLTAEHPRHAAGNLGLEDQQAALRWVRRNIRAFGGDPRRVTIFGESAGGMSVCAQLLSPGAARLFRRAITQSGPCLTPLPPRAAAEAQGQRLAEILGCAGAADPLACLRTKPVRDVLAALPPDPTFLFDRSVNWVPTADGVVLPADPVRALRRGRFHRVPVIVGATRDEGRLFVGMAYNAVGRPLTADRWADEVDRYFGAAGSQVRTHYPLADHPDPGAAFGQAIGDAILACPAVESARLLARRVPVWLYQYDHAPNPFVLPMPGIDLGAFHSAELPYVFAGPVLSSGAFTFTPAEEELARLVTGAWTRFAARGRPDGAGLYWPRLRRPSNRYLSLDTPVAVRRDMKRDECAFWAELGWSLAPPS